MSEFLSNWKNLYPYNYDEIIYNPKLHFYTRGIKFASLDVVKKLKQNRGEDKDYRDIKLIDSVITDLKGKLNNINIW